MKENKKSRSGYIAVAVPLILAGVLAGVDTYKTYKNTTAKANYAIETQDYTEAKRILKIFNSEIKDGSLILPISRDTESRLKEMLKQENPSSK